MLWCLAATAPFSGFRLPSPCSGLRSPGKPEFRSPYPRQLFVSILSITYVRIRPPRRHTRSGSRQIPPPSARALGVPTLFDNPMYETHVTLGPRRTGAHTRPGVSPHSGQDRKAIGGEPEPEKPLFQNEPKFPNENGMFRQKMNLRPT